MTSPAISLDKNIYKFLKQFQSRIFETNRLDSYLDQAQERHISPWLRYVNGLL